MTERSDIREDYLSVLKEELVPAMGCTEPISVAYASALARAALGEIPDTVEICVSANIIKNVKSVVVPNTGGMRGLSAAAAAGILAGDATRELEVIASLSGEDIKKITEYLATAAFHITRSDSGHIFDIGITLKKGEHSAGCRIVDNHTNVVYLAKDGVEEKNVRCEEGQDAAADPDRSFMSVAGILEYAMHTDLEKPKVLLEKQVRCNMAIAEEGIKNRYGAEVGRTILECGDNTVLTRAKAYAAAASDARMSGCNMPVVINSGSGNQGLTASVPVIVYAKESGCPEEKLYRALLISNLVTIHLKTGIGCLSAYCGAVSAGCGAAAGICYLAGGGKEQIMQTVANALEIDSGMICDGANTNCAAKIASSLEAGFLAMRMTEKERKFGSGEGIYSDDLEQSITNTGRLASCGMVGTDREIISMMI